MKRKFFILAISVIYLTVSILFISSCKKDDPEPPAPVPTSMVLLSGGSQSANIGSTLVNDVEVKVKDQNGDAFKGAKVNFTVTEGSVSTNSVTTDTEGKASIFWTLGATEGNQNLSITSFKSDDSGPLAGSPITVTATAIKESGPDSVFLTLVSGGDQTGGVKMKLENKIKVLVANAEGNPLKGVNVDFSVTEGSLSTDSEETNLLGNAEVSWTLGETEGTQTLMVTAFQEDGTTPLSGSPLSVNAAANPRIASSIELESGADQIGEIDKLLERSIRVRVKDQYGIVIQGTEVYFAVSEGAVSTSSMLSNDVGQVSTDWTLGSTIGTQSLTVTAFESDGITHLNGSPLLINATAKILEASSIELVSVGELTGETETTLPFAITILVKDEDGKGYEGATVNFSVTEGSVTEETMISEVNGYLSTFWTLGPTSGTQELTITCFQSDGVTEITGSPLILTANAFTPTSIELVSGSDQSGSIGVALENPIIIMVKDQDGNPFRNGIVNFEVSEGEVSSGSITTESDGLASIDWTLGTTEGTQTLNVTSFRADGITELEGSPLNITATAESLPPPPDVTDYDGNVYKTVKIGEQIWMAENLKVTHFADGTPIPYVSNTADWGALEDNDTDKAYCYYDDDPESEYGALYTWAAAMNGSESSFQTPSGVQGVCPDGWHLPATGLGEWTALMNYVGGKQGGGKLKETGTDHWNSLNEGATNVTGFTALGGGIRQKDGAFKFKKEHGRWWSATEANSIWGNSFILYYNQTTIIMTGYNKSGGLSVRCVKDED